MVLFRFQVILLCIIVLVIYPLVPEQLLEVRTVKRNNCAHVEWLIKWQQQPLESASWESADMMVKKFPSFDPWGQGSA